MQNISRFSSIHTGKDQGKASGTGVLVLVLVIVMIVVMVLRGCAAANNVSYGGNVLTDYKGGGNGSSSEDDGDGCYGAACGSAGVNADCNNSDGYNSSAEGMISLAGKPISYVHHPYSAQISI